MKITKQGFTLIELIGAIIIILILVSIILVVNGTARTDTLAARVQTDLEALNTAKQLWVVDHPGQASSFPSDESARYTLLKPYLDPQQAAGSLVNFEPAGETYTINTLGVPATASP